MMADLVHVDIRDHIAAVTLNRPDKMNALSIPMFEAIAAAGKRLAMDRSLRAVVLAGAGKSFCAGIDTDNFSDIKACADLFGPERGGPTPNFYQSAAWIWRELPVPVICALHGVVFGGGLQIALAADLRIAHPATRLSVMEIHWGLVPDMAASQTLRDLVRLDVAKELTFSGRIVEAAEAQQLGLVTSVHETPREAALELAAQIASRNPDAVSYAKYLFNQHWQGKNARGLRAEEYVGKRLLGSTNQREAVASRLQQRPASFSDRELDDYTEIDLD